MVPFCDVVLMLEIPLHIIMCNSCSPAQESKSLLGDTSTMLCHSSSSHNQIQNRQLLLG